MADLPQQNTIVQYLADGITDTYDVPFYTPLEADGTPNLDVFTQLSTAEPIPENDLNEWNVDYTYTPLLDPIRGGIVEFIAGHVPPSGYVVTIVRNVSASLDVEFAQAATFSGITLDAALDKLLLISQQNKSYTLGRNLSYIVNSYLPNTTISANVQIPVLEDGQVWFGSSDGVIAATLEQPADVSTLRSELANEAPVTNGAHLVGFYDDVNNASTTVEAQLNYLTGLVVAPFPTGSIIDFGGDTAPAGFLVCDGSAVSRATYDELFDVIGTIWGIGNGTTTFNLPDLMGKVTAGAGGDLFSATDAVGDDGGEALHTMTIQELVVHHHTYTSKQGTSGQNLQGGASQINNELLTLNTSDPLAGSDSAATEPFNIVQPTAITLKIIKT